MLFKNKIEGLLAIADFNYPSGSLLLIKYDEWRVEWQVGSA